MATRAHFARSRAVAAVLLLHALALWALCAHDSLPRPAQGKVAYMQMVAARQSPQRPAEPARKVAQRLAPPLRRPAAADVPAQLSTPTMEAAATPAAAPAPSGANPDPFALAPPRLDVDALRKLARADEQRREPTPLERVRDSQRIRASADTDTARAIAQSARPDCRKASGDSTAFNIFGLIPLAYATITDTGCKW